MGAAHATSEIGKAFNIQPHTPKEQSQDLKRRRRHNVIFSFHTLHILLATH